MWRVRRRNRSDRARRRPGRGDRAAPMYPAGSGSGRNAALRRRAFANGKIPAARPGRHSVEFRLVREENGNALPGDRARRSRPGARQPLVRSEGAAAGPPSMRRAAMRAAAVKCRTAAVDGGCVMVAVWKSDLVGSDQLGGGLTPTGGKCQATTQNQDSLIRVENSLIARFNFLLRRKKFPVPMRREFPRN